MAEAMPAQSPTEGLCEAPRPYSTRAPGRATHRCHGTARGGAGRRRQRLQTGCPAVPGVAMASGTGAIMTDTLLDPWRDAAHLKVEPKRHHDIDPTLRSAGRRSSWLLRRGRRLHGLLHRGAIPRRHPARVCGGVLHNVHFQGRALAHQQVLVPAIYRCAGSSACSGRLKHVCRLVSRAAHARPASARRGPHTFVADGSHGRAGQFGLKAVLRLCRGSK